MNESLNLKKKVAGITAVFIVIILIVTGIYAAGDYRNKKTSESGMLAVDKNEIEQLIDDGDTETAKEKLEELSVSDTEDTAKKDRRYLVYAGISIVYAITIFSYVYVRILGPFDRLHKFAAKVAEGDLDTPIEQERGQYFGEFTWAFDNMRSEIKKAREGEKQAIINNKTVIAELSHDIKTPVSAIRSYCEALEAGFDKTPEKRARYLSTIIDKCDEVGRLTDDLFTHSVSDMDKLSVVPVQMDIKEFTANYLDERLKVTDKTESKTNIKADPARLSQVFENIIGNASKYAGTDVDLELTEKDGKVSLTFRDYGKGIPEENLPFITQKFYRGSNTENIQGSGLGLYIVSYLCGKMRADLAINNVYEGGACKGLEIKILFEKVS